MQMCRYLLLLADTPFPFKLGRVFVICQLRGLAPVLPEAAPALAARQPSVQRRGALRRDIVPCAALTGAFGRKAPEHPSVPLVVAQTGAQGPGCAALKTLPCRSKRRGASGVGRVQTVGAAPQLGSTGRVPSPMLLWGPVRRSLEAESYARWKVYKPRL